MEPPLSYGGVSSSSSSSSPSSSSSIPTSTTNLNRHFGSGIGDDNDDDDRFPADSRSGRIYSMGIASSDADDAEGDVDVDVDVVEDVDENGDGNADGDVRNGLSSFRDTLRRSLFGNRSRGVVIRRRRRRGRSGAGSVLRSCGQFIWRNKLGIVLFTGYLVLLVLTIKASHCQTNGIREILGVIEDRISEQHVIPLRKAHAHNDYLQSAPLTDALSYGFCSVEADVFLRDGRLLLGHSSPGNSTLEDVYLRPLFQRIKANEGTVFMRSFPLNMCEQVTLLVDLKFTEFGVPAIKDQLNHKSKDQVRFEQFQKTWSALEASIEALEEEFAQIWATEFEKSVSEAPLTIQCFGSHPKPRSKNHFRKYNTQNGAVDPVAPLRVIVSGIEAPEQQAFAEFMLQERPTNRCSQLDGRIGNIESASGKPFVSPELTAVLGMVSDDYWEALNLSRIVPTNKSKHDLMKSIRTYVDKVHGLGLDLPARFFGTPEEVQVWEMLLLSGMDRIGVDYQASLRSLLLFEKISHDHF